MTESHSFHLRTNEILLATAKAVQATGAHLLRYTLVLDEELIKTHHDLKKILDKLTGDVK